MSDTLAMLFVLFFFVTLVFFSWSNLDDAKLLGDCERKHNVYECELVAVPKEGK